MLLHLKKSFGKFWRSNKYDYRLFSHRIFFYFAYSPKLVRNIVLAILLGFQNSFSYFCGKIFFSAFFCQHVVPTYWISMKSKFGCVSGRRSSCCAWNCLKTILGYVVNVFCSLWIFQDFQNYFPHLSSWQNRHFPSWERLSSEIWSSWDVSRS